MNYRTKCGSEVDFSEVMTALRKTVMYHRCVVLICLDTRQQHVYSCLSMCANQNTVSHSFTFWLPSDEIPQIQVQLTLIKSFRVIFI